MWGKRVCLCHFENVHIHQCIVMLSSRNWMHSYSMRIFLCIYILMFSMSLEIFDGKFFVEICRCVSR